jgi:hypothetical protein
MIETRCAMSPPAMVRQTAGTIASTNEYQNSSKHLPNFGDSALVDTRNGQRERSGNLVHCHRIPIFPIGKPRQCAHATVCGSSMSKGSIRALSRSKVAGAM